MRGRDCKEVKNVVTFAVVKSRMDIPGRSYRWAFGALVLLTLLAVALGVAARVYHLGFPDKRMWDEVYFPVFARNYLVGKNFFDLHPPLGKFIIAVGLLIYGDTPLGWRVMSDAFGVGMIFIAAGAGWYFLRDRAAALLMGLFVASETMFIVYSRAGLMDGILTFFVLATMAAAWRTKTLRGVAFTALLFGLTVAIKWATAPLVIPAGYVMWRKGYLRPFIGSLYISVVAYLIVVYLGQLINHDHNPWRAFVDVWLWHIKAAEQITRAVPNTEASPWWAWPLMTRPILFFYRPAAAGEPVRTVLALGNLAIWWPATLSVLAGIYELGRRLLLRLPVADHPLVPIVLGWIFLLLPWVPGTRIPFVYNYFPAYAFALLALAYWALVIWRRRPWLVVGYCAVVIGVAIYFLPMTMGLPMSPVSLKDHLWLLSWNHPEYIRTFQINRIFPY